MYSYITFVLQLKKIQPLENNNLASDLDSNRSIIVSLLQNFNSICKRYTIAMATKHRLQDHMLTNSSDNNLIDAVIYLETAALRLQQIQVSSLTRTIVLLRLIIYYVYIFQISEATYQYNLLGIYIKTVPNVYLQL